MRQPSVLIAMGDESLRKDLRSPLLWLGLSIMESHDQTCTLGRFQKGGLDLIIIGLSPDHPWDSLEVARQIRALDKKIPLVLIMASSSEELAIAALKAGVNDYFKQPIPWEELTAAIRRYLSDFFTPVSIDAIKIIPSRLLGGQRMVGESPLMEAIRTYLYKVASADSNVLITGETGTGKELVAELIHKNSSRHRKSLSCINCAAIPDSLLESELFGYEKGAFTGADTPKEGKLRLASGGTVFFDEIGDMSPYA